jgi:hypothetical protein
VVLFPFLRFHSRIDFRARALGQPDPVWLRDVMFGLGDRLPAEPRDQLWSRCAIEGMTNGGRLSQSMRCTMWEICLIAPLPKLVSEAGSTLEGLALMLGRERSRAGWE